MIVKPNMTIEDYILWHNPCREATRWMEGLLQKARSGHKRRPTMKDVWNLCPDPAWVGWVFYKLIPREIPSGQSRIQVRTIAGNLFNNLMTLQIDERMLRDYAEATSPELYNLLLESFACTQGTIPMDQFQALQKLAEACEFGLNLSRGNYYARDVIRYFATGRVSMVFYNSVSFLHFDSRIDQDALLKAVRESLPNPFVFTF